MTETGASSLSRDQQDYLQLSSREKRALLASLLRGKAQRAAAASSLSHGQQALWLLHRRAPGNAAYNTAFAVRVRSPIDVEALRAAFQTMTDRHASLRTTFATQNGQPLAVTSARQDAAVTQIDARGWTWEDLRWRVAEDYRRPFDLERGPLMRVSLYSRQDDDHVLLLALHHIVCDAWSMWVLMHELSVLYPAAAAGGAAALPPVEAQYPDFVQWQQQLLQGPEGERLWQYWRERLSGDLPVLDLPISGARPPLQTMRGASRFFEIDGGLARDLTQLGKAQGATLFVCLLAVFQTLLHRYSGQDDIIVGSPVAGRNNPDMATTIGYLANALPLRVDLSGDPPFREVIGRVRQIVLGALAHQDFPFPLLIERLQPKRDPSRWPVMEVMFVLQRPPNSEEFLDLLGNETGGQFRWGGLDVEPFALAQMEGQFDLTWEVVERRQALSCVLKYNPELFEAETIGRMEGHLATLIQAVVENPEQRISQLRLMAPAERERVLEAWQGAETAYPLERCLHHWIEDQVERAPGRTAVVMADGSGGRLSYRELNARANRLARHLRAIGVERDTVVGVLAERSLDLVIALLGVLKAGAAYLPLDPDYPGQRLAFMMADAQVPVLLTHRALSERVPPSACTVVRLDADWPAIARHDAANPAVEVGPDDLAYVIYTSGSTGQPKGAENTHRAICNRLLWMQDEYALDASDRVLQKTPFSFDVSVWEFFWPLMTGATLVMARPGGHRDRDYLVDAIADHGVTTLHFVPSMLQVFLGAGSLSRCRASLRRVFCSGEALPMRLQQRFFDRLDVELYNLYGPTEAAVDVTHWRCRRDSDLPVVPIGKPIANTRIRLLDRNLQPVPIGVPGELHIGGVPLARGYRNRRELTAEKFIWHALDCRPAERLYRTGDLCRWMPDGNIEYLGRIDFQVKLRGFRIELGEVETALASHPGVADAVVRLELSDGDAQLAAWIVPQPGERPSGAELRRFLNERLPDYMVPTAIASLASLPLSPNGKVDRAALPRPEPASPMVAKGIVPRTAAEQRIADIWRGVLRTEKLGLYDNFFDLGGHSLLLADVQTRLAEAFGKAPPIVDMFRLTTVHALAGFYAVPEPAPPAARATADDRRAAPEGAADIAIIGMAGRFPGAPDVETLWRNLCGGVESVTVFDAAQLAAAGVEPTLLRDPNYVGAFGALSDIESFDAGLFGFTPRELELMDVQHRLLLECAWVALEDAAHDPQAEDRRYGMFAGVGMNRYLLNNLIPHPGLIEAADPYQLMLGNDKDFAPTRTSYKLNLKGPSVSVQTACSTSLVAVHLACRSLLARECDAALAGGCSVTLPQDTGYLYREGMILSPDGHCRAFDAEARGTVGGNGVGLVVLKRLQDALADGDGIYAVIKGSAINNDGSGKAGFTAPGVSGQEAAISAALADAGVEPDTIGYVEAHGTGTPLGDPIEIAALTRVFRAATDRRNYCAIGSVKTNLGHLDSAAGVTGLIKAALSVKHAMVPPSLHYQAPNPELELEQSPFFVPTKLRPWAAGELPRRAGVSSFGIGGTNAHVVLEQPPDRPPSGPSRPYQLVVLSAQQPEALHSATVQLEQYFGEHPETHLADAAFTLACGRRAFGHRRMLVCRTLDEAAKGLGTTAAQEARQAVKVYTSFAEPLAGGLAFMFPGQGTQHVGMAAEIYRSEPVFRAQVDRCAGLLEPDLKLDLRDLLYPPGDQIGSAQENLRRTAVAQPALFVVGYALAQLWMSWGVRPDALIGHSLGEYVAACVAGVWTLEDALALVALRAGLMQRQPAGGMLAVSLPEAQTRELLRPDLSLAAVNGPGLCVVSGPHEAVAGLAGELALRDVACSLLPTSHAFHSAMMEPVLEPFRARLREVECRPPAIPFVSNVTGTWIEPEQAVDPGYWTRHLRCTVRFADGLETLLQQPQCVVEVGPGNTLATLAARHPARPAGQTVVSSLPHAQAQKSDSAHLMEAAGRLWLAGTPIDWPGFYAGQSRRRLHLPSYPFQRQRYWVDAPRGRTISTETTDRNEDMDEWFYLPSWRRTPPPAGTPAPGTRWLLLMDECGLGAALAARLSEHGITATRVHAGSRFVRRQPGDFVLEAGSRDDYRLLFEDLRRSDDLPDVVVHLWNVTAAGAAPAPAGLARDQSFHSLVFLAQALGERAVARPCHIAVVSTQLHDVTGGEPLQPLKALLLGPVAVIPQEYAQLACSSIDLDLAPRYRDRQVEYLLADAALRSGQLPLAYRGGHRWVQDFVPAPLAAKAPPVRPRGTYVIAGGTGGVGLALAEWLAQAAPGVKLALIARSAVSADKPLSQHPEGAGERPSETPAAGRGEFPRLREMAAGFGQAHARLSGQSSHLHHGLAEIRKTLDRLCLLYIARFLQQSGISLQPGQRHDREQIRSRLRLLPKFEKFLSFFLRVLTEDGILSEENGSLLVRQALPAEMAEEASRELHRRFPDLARVDDLLRHCVQHFGPALRGDIEALSVLYPEGTLALRGAEDQLAHTLSLRGRYIEMAAEIIGQVAGGVRGRKLRILEVGGGGGELTLALMQRLRGGRLEYWFTDIGRSIVLSAERKAAELDFASMRFAVLDISSDPVDQGIQPGSFDLIVGLDVVHTTPRVEAALGHLKKLLLPGGLLCLLESVKPQRYLDMIWGLADGWWHFEDHELRTCSPLLAIPQWMSVLHQVGFAEVEAWPPPGAEREASDFGLIVAQREAAPQAAEADRAAFQRVEPGADGAGPAIRRLREIGAEVFTLQADVADRAQMQGAIGRIRQRFGDINGVIHAAGIAGGGTIEVKTREGAEREIAAKVDGSLVLAAVLGETPLDFFVLCSSLTSTTGGFGQVAYSAASAFEDAFAQARASQGSPGRSISIDWDRWQNLGMAAALEARHHELTGEALGGGMRPSEAVEVFGRILAGAPAAQVIVSTRNFPALVKQSRSWQLGRIEGQMRRLARHPRPRMASDYVAPCGETERLIAEIWQQELGIEQVGAQDDFFALGGDSLIAIKLMSRLRHSLDVPLSVRTLYEAPTISALAEHAASIRWVVEGGAPVDLAERIEEGVL
nr:condensation domain-containing protein [uncultured bacterium]